ncbi:mycofactocin-associated electron transfer flavoprotein beta subunit [Amycolatopsis sp. cg5]|uniref:mycofactocin-associated electron transfer flavoprotein beta subunit n=1 Tax=Amycolatopsis sp. cg5 TaxID=3238802 RepID=UPI00352687F6
MLIVVALRWIESRTSGLGAADECALEHALRLSERLDGRTLAVTAGPEPAEVVLRTALAAGIGDTLRVDLTEDETDDGSRVAKALADAIPAPDLVLCGDHSADRGTGATPAFLAAALGARQALGALSLAWDGKLLVERRLDGGRRERLDVDLPAVCSVEPADVRLRRASLPGLLAARKATITVHKALSTRDSRVAVTSTRPFSPRTRRVPPPEGAEPHTRLLALTGALAEHDPPRLVHPADAKAGAVELLAYLRQHGYLA